MPTNIDSLQIEIQSNSTNAATNIRDLATALGELKKNSSVNVAIKNLNNLSAALKNFTVASNATTAIGKLVGAMAKLKSVGSVGGVGNALNKLSASLKSLQSINIDKVKPQIDSLAAAVVPLSNIKAGGLNTMLNSLKKLGQVTDDLDDAKITAFKEKIDRLVAALEPLSTKLTTIKTGLQGFNSSAKTAGSSVKQMGDNINSSSVNLSSFIFNIQSAVQWMQQLIQAFQKVISQAIEWDGILYQFGNTFGEEADMYYEKITKISDALMINKQTFMENSAIAGSMLIGFGVDKSDAREMGVGYTELAYDIWAAFNNIYTTFDGADGAMAAIRSAIAGEVEPIRRAGFTVVESTLEQTAANHGLSISIEKATEAQKSYLRYLSLVDQAHLKGIVGAYAREMNTAEGMMRTFSQQLKSLSQAFGSLFLPILVKVMPYLQAFVELLIEAVHWVASLFGIKIQDIGDTWNDYSSSIGSAAENTENVTGALNDATKAAKELKNATLGIDELNVISPSSSSSGSGSGAGGAGGGGFEGLDVGSLWDESIFDSIQSDVDEIKEKLRGWMPVIAGVAAGLAGLRLIKLLKDIQAIAALSGAIGAVGGAFKGIKEFFAAAKQMAPEVGWLAALFPKLSGWFASIGTAISGAATAVGSFLAGISAPVWATIAVVIAAIASVVYYLYKNWDELGKAVKNFFDQNIAPKLENIKGHFEKIKESLEPITIALEPVVKWFKELGIAIADFFKNIEWDKIWKFLGNLVEYFGHNIFATLTTPFVVAFNVMVGVVENFIQVVSGIIQTVSGVVEFVVAIFTGGDIEKAVKKMTSGIKDIFGGLVGFIVDPIKNIYHAVVDWFTELWDVLVGHSIIPDMVNDIVKWFKGLPGKVFDSLSKFFTELPKKFSKMWSDLKTWWNNKSPLKAYTPSIGSIKDKLSSAWSSAKTWWNERRSDLAKYTPSIGSIRDKLSSAWTTAKNWWSKSKASLSYTPSIGSIKDKLISAWNTAKTWWKNNVKLSIPSLSFKVTYEKATGWKKAIVNALGLDGWPKLSFAANGGIFDTGSLIWAGERGPEIMANAGGGKTGVMNVQQMADAVYEGVYAAVIAANRASAGSGEQAVHVYLDGREITKSVEKRQRERGATIMGTQVYSY